MATNKKRLGPKSEKSINTAEVLNAISDDKSLVLFNTIASRGGDSTILISNLRFSRKQYYTRMRTLQGCGLIKKVSSGYGVTSFGNIVFHALNKIEKAIKYLWRLEAIDSLDSSVDKIPNQERRKIIDTIIDSEEVKRILLEGEGSIAEDIQNNRKPQVMANEGDDNNNSGRSLTSPYTRYST